MQPIVHFKSLSNRSPEKCGLRQLKGANPCPRFTPFELWLQTNIQNNFATNPHQIAEVIGNCAVYIKIMISQIIKGSENLWFVGDTCSFLVKRYLSFPDDICNCLRLFLYRCYSGFLEQPYGVCSKIKPQIQKILEMKNTYKINP